MSSFDFIGFGNTDKASAHFAHANGFHPKMYRPLISNLDQLSVQSILFRPYDPKYKPESLTSWKDLVTDFLQSVDHQNLKFDFGLGHSMGAIVTLLAAVKRPGLFKKIVLLDPVVLPKKFGWFSILPISIRKKIIPVAKIALKRKDTWESKQAVYDHLRNKRAYKNLPEEAFNLFLEHGFSTNAVAKISLTYTKEWEAQIYATPPNPWAYLKKVKCPVLIIRGVHSDVLTTDGSWQTMNKTLPHIQFLEVADAGHLVPLEKGPQIAPLIQEFLFN